MNRNLYGKIFCLFGCLLTATICFSQKHSRKFGISASSAISWAAVSGDIKPDGAGFAFDFSATTEKYFSERFGYYMGLSFVGMSGKIKNASTARISLKSGNPGPDIGESAKYSIHYLTVPVGIALKTRQYGRFSYYLRGGLLPGVRLGSSIAAGEEKHSLSKDTNLMACAVQFSSGLLYPTGGNTFLTAGIVFNSFFTDTFSASNMKVSPSSIGLQAGFSF